MGSHNKWMKKAGRSLMVIAFSVSFLIFTACGNDLVKTGNDPLENPVYSNDYISLAAYTGLQADQVHYTVTNENIEESIREQLSDYADYKSVLRASKDKDWVYFDYTATIDGKTVSESDDGEYYIVLGDAEFGEEFDGKVTGVKKGDSLEFEITYPKDYENDTEWAGNTVHFSVSITDVQEEVLPEVTKSFLKKELDCGSYEELQKKTEESLAQSYEEESVEELKENLLSQVVDASSILAYEKSAYEAAYQEALGEYEEYAEMFGTDIEEIYDMLGVTEEDLEESAYEILYRNIVMDAIAENEHITVDEAEYQSGLEYYADRNGYESTDDLLEDFSKEDILEQLKEDKVQEVLVDNAKLTEVTKEYGE